MNNERFPWQMVHDTSHCPNTSFIVHGPYPMLHLTTPAHHTTPCYNPHHVWPERQTVADPAGLRGSAVRRFEVCPGLLCGLSAKRLRSPGSEVCRHVEENR